MARRGRIEGAPNTSGSRRAIRLDRRNRRKADDEEDDSPQVGEGGTVTQVKEVDRPRGEVVQAPEGAEFRAPFNITEAMRQKEALSKREQEEEANLAQLATDIGPAVADPATARENVVIEEDLRNVSESTPTLDEEFGLAPESLDLERVQSLLASLPEAEFEELIRRAMEARGSAG